MALKGEIAYPLFSKVHEDGIINHGHIIIIELEPAFCSDGACPKRKLLTNFGLHLEMIQHLSKLLAKQGSFIA